MKAFAYASNAPNGTSSILLRAASTLPSPSLIITPTEPQQGLAAPKILKNYFILCISIKKFKYLATKIEVGPPKCLN